MASSEDGGAEPHRRALLDAYRAALAAVGGRESAARHLASRDGPMPTHVIAIGKAASYMAAGAFDVLGDAITAALVVTKHGHLDDVLDGAWPVHALESSHPVPDETCLAAGEAILDFVASAPPGARFACLVSGGASALAEALPRGLSAADLARVNDWLLASGHPIGEMNRVRKRLSRLKGGRLAGLVAPRPVLNLMISDVPGDDPKAVGSGPLIPHAPEDLDVSHMELPDWLADMVAAAPPLSEPAAFDAVESTIVARPLDARRAAEQACLAAGYAVTRHDALLEGDAVTTGEQLAARLREASPGIEIWGSETTVVLPERPGRGGRCQALGLAAALGLRDVPGAMLLAVGTDGTDGPGVDAGALVDAGSAARGEAAGLDARDCLARADAGTFLEASGDLVHTGPTGTNVMDLVLALRAES